MHPSWNHDAHMSIDMRTLETEMPSEFFPLCEVCFWIPEHNPWTEEFIGPFEGIMCVRVRAPVCVH